MYTVKDVASYVVTKCDNDLMPVSNLKLQKILYYIQKKYMKKGMEAFAEDFQAWKYGPVVPEIYHYYSYYGGLPLTTVPNDAVDIQEADRAIIDSIVEEKRLMRPWQLVSETHKPGGAWALTYKGGAGNRRKIEKDLIRKEAINEA